MLLVSMCFGMCLLSDYVAQNPLSTVLIFRGLPRPCWENPGVYPLKTNKDQDDCQELLVGTGLFSTCSLRCLAASLQEQVKWIHGG